jgi:hypothetical protein
MLSQKIWEIIDINSRHLNIRIQATSTLTTLQNIPNSDAVSPSTLPFDFHNCHLSVETITIS